MEGELRLSLVLIALVVIFAVLGSLMYLTVTNVRVSMEVYGITSQTGGVQTALVKFEVKNNGYLPFSATYSVFFSYVGLPPLIKNYTVSLSPGQKEVFYLEVPALQSLQSVEVIGHGIYDYNFRESFSQIVSNISVMSVKLAMNSTVPQTKGFYLQEKVLPGSVSYSFVVTISKQTLYINGTRVYYVNVTFFPLSNGGIRIAPQSNLIVQLGNSVETFVVLPGKSYTVIAETTTFPIKFNFNVTGPGGTLLGYGVYNVTA